MAGAIRERRPREDPGNEEGGILPFWLQPQVSSLINPANLPFLSALEQKKLQTCRRQG